MVGNNIKKTRQGSTSGKSARFTRKVVEMKTIDEILKRHLQEHEYRAGHYELLKQEISQMVKDIIGEPLCKIPTKERGRIVAWEDVVSLRGLKERARKAGLEL